LAIRAHKGQVRAGTTVPYVTHPVECAALLAAMGAPEEVQAAAVLHDVVEDTPVTSYELERLVGARVAALVAEVTDPEGMIGPVAKARQMALAEAGEYSEGAALIKMADCVSNARDLVRRPPPWEGSKIAHYTRFLDTFVRTLRWQSDLAERLGWEFDSARNV
jgi:(p)ppGpp synthase/HD superfamily hydrolase